jgi:site-specific DNA recombinase
MGSEPTPPPPGTIERLHTYLADTIASGTPAERKAAIEALVAEVRVTEEGVIPVFRIPGPRTPIPGGNDTTAATEPVRAMVRSVGRLGLEPRTGGL